MTSHFDWSNSGRKRRPEVRRRRERDRGVGTGGRGEKRRGGPGWGGGGLEECGFDRAKGFDHSGLTSQV